MNTPNYNNTTEYYFSSYERKHMTLFVVLKHIIKLSTSIKQKSTTNKESRMSDQYDNIYTLTA